MRKLLWPVRIGVVTLALVFLPAETGDAGLTRAALCAAQADGGDCAEEFDSYCKIDGTYIVDATPKS